MGTCHSRSEESELFSLFGNKAKSFKFSDKDFAYFAFHGDISKIKVALAKQEIPDILSSRGFSQKLFIKESSLSLKSVGKSTNSSYADEYFETSPIKDKPVDTVMWNPIHFSVINNKLEVIMYIFQNKEINPLLTLQKSQFQNENQIAADVLSTPEKCFAMQLAIQNKRKQLFNYLLNDLYYLWNKKCLIFIAQEILTHNFTEGGMEVLVQGKCFQRIMTDLRGRVDLQIELLNQMFFPLFKLPNEDQKEESKGEISKQQSIDKQKQAKKLKWKQILYKLFLNSPYSIIFALYLINTNYYKIQNLYIQLVNETIKETSNIDGLTENQLNACVKDFSLLDPQVRLFYEKVQEIMCAKVPYLVVSHDNLGIQLLRTIKRGDTIGLQSILSKVKKYRLEEICDDYGEVDFNEDEMDQLMMLFSSSDASLIRKINPIQLALIYNQQLLLQLMIERLDLVLRRKHIKNPNYKKLSESQGLMLFKSAVEFRHYTILIYVWDNYPYLFRTQDLLEGFKLFVKKREIILAKHFLASASMKQFFNSFSFAYRFVFLKETIFQELKTMNEERQEHTDFINMISQELAKQPYSFYSFSLFYERGDIYECLQSLEETQARDIKLFVNSDPEGAEKFLIEIQNDEVAMKLQENCFKKETIQMYDQKLQGYAPLGKLQAQKIREEYTLNNMKLFREAMSNLGRQIQLELKILDFQDNRTQTKSSDHHEVQEK